MRFYRPSVAVLVGALSVVAAAKTADAESLKSLSDAAFHELEEIIAAIEATQPFEAVKGEIAVAKKLVTHGKLLLRAGRTKKAAILAERLQFQIALVRAIAATGEAAAELRKTEGQVFEMEQKLKMLRGRLNHLRLEVDGAKATSAFPPATEVQ
jgi:hypothetical protein